jgi:hypothetical protein
MQKLTIAAFTLFSFSSTVLLAQVPVLRDQVLTIPQAAVVTSAGQRYYSNVTLRSNADGSFSVLTAEEHALAAVQTVTAQVTATPTSVVAKVVGYLPTPCDALEPAAVSYKSGEFTVVIGRRSTLGPDTLCAQVIADFQTEVALDIKGLPAGDYRVVVNGVAATFKL